MASSIQILRSTIARERPLPSNLLEGQPAVSLNAQEPGLFFKASDGSLVKIGPAAITSDGNPPNTGGVGQLGNTIGELWLDKFPVVPVLRVYDGSQWIDAGSGGQLPGQVTLLRWSTLATVGQTVLSGSDSSSQQLTYTAGLEEVYVNGAFLRRGADYTATNGSTITVSTPLTLNDEITVLAWAPFVIGSQIVNADVNPNAGITSNKLSFTQSGTGATARTVDSKLKDVVSVKDFGAVGDGVADDTAAINAAIARLNANPGSTLTGSPGTYLVGKLTPITAAGTSLLLDGVTFKSKPDSLAVVNDTLLTINANKCTIRGLVIDGNQNAYTARVGSYLIRVYGSGHLLDGVSVINSPYEGIDIGAFASDCRFISCRFDDNSNLGMQLVRSSYMMFENCSFNRNGYGFQQTKTNPADVTHAFEAFGFAIRFRSHHVTFVNCVANDNGRDGMNVNQGSYAVKFIGCEASRNDDGGFTIAADSTNPAIPGDGESCWDIEHVGCEAANNYTSGLAAYQPVHNITVTGGRYYNNNRVAGDLSAANSFTNGLFFAGASSSVLVDTKAYDERQARVITAISGGQLTATGWVSGTKDYYPKVAILSVNGVFRGYGKITSESAGVVTITPTTFHGVTLGSIIAGDTVTQRVQHVGVFAGNGVLGRVSVDAFGETKGAPNADVTGFKVFSGCYGDGQNVYIRDGYVGEELIVNPSFDSNITSWAVNTPGGGAANHVTTGVIKSAGALELIGGSSSAQADAAFIPNVLKHVSDSFIQAACWVYSTQRAQAGFQFFWDPNASGLLSTTVFHPGGGWKRLIIGCYLPSTVSNIIVRCMAEAGATTYWDTATLKAVQVGTDDRDRDVTSRSLPF